MIAFLGDVNYCITSIGMCIGLLPISVIPNNFENIINHANGVYCAAIAFIYAHEFSHNYLGHTQIQQTLSHTVDDEIDADDTAISFIQTEYDSAWGNTYKAGVATVLAALLLMGEDSISGGGTHPDMDVRIENLVAKLDLHEMDPLWGYLGVAVKIMVTCIWWFIHQRGLCNSPDLAHIRRFIYFIWQS